jgi:tRNA threonylcarbamoyladenosine biosynthesis protein TsaB
MRILAIETSTLLGGVAVADDSSGLIAEVRLNVKSTHSERLMTEIDHVMKRSGLQVSDIDAFAVSIGPGSFTGLRIGVSTVKGFSYATGRPIVTVPTLEAFAWNFPFSRYPVCTLLDARKKEVYAALFRWVNGDFDRLIGETSTKVDMLLEKIKAGEGKDDGRFFEKIIFAGEGALLYGKEITDVLGGRAIFAPPDKMVPSPSAIASVGLRKVLREEFSEPVSLVPLYVRRSEAEIKWNG